MDPLILQSPFVIQAHNKIFPLFKTFEMTFIGFHPSVLFAIGNRDSLRGVKKIVAKLDQALTEQPPQEITHPQAFIDISFWNIP